MARRPLTSDVITGLRGWIYQYGYRGFSSKGPQTVISTPVRDDLYRGFMNPIAEKVTPLFFNQDALENPADGKVLAKEDMELIIQWTQLDYVRQLFRREVDKLRPYFVTKTLPVNVDTLYITYIYDLNVEEYPWLKGANFRISLPVKGNGHPQLTCSYSGGTL